MAITHEDRNNSSLLFSGRVRLSNEKAKYILLLLFIMAVGGWVLYFTLRACFESQEIWLSPSHWQSSALSWSGEDLSPLAHDGNCQTRWDTTRTQRHGDWYRLDLGRLQRVTKIILDSRHYPNDYPRRCRLLASSDDTAYHTVATAVTSNAAGLTYIRLNTPQLSRYLKIVLKTSDPNSQWSIGEIRVYALPEDSFRWIIGILPCVIFFVKVISIIAIILFIILQREEADATVLYYKREYIIWLVSLILSLLFYVLIANIISKFYHPDVQRIARLAEDISINKGAIFQPEPLEQALVMTGVIVLPISLLLLYYIATRVLRTINYKLLNLLYPVAVLGGMYLLITLIYLALTSREGDGCYGHTNLQFYFHMSLPCNKFYLYSFIIYPVILLSFLLRQPHKYTILKKAATLISRAFFNISSLLLILMVFVWNIFPLTTFPTDSYHFNPIFYPSTQIYLGKALWIDGFTHTYGLFAHFLNPIFNLIGLNVLTFSIVMSFLLALSFLFIFLILHSILENKRIVFLGFTTVLFLGYLFGKIEMREYYFQYHPLRLFPPCLIAFLALCYIKNRNRILYYSTFIISSMAILWNFDSGIVVYLSWISLLCYMELSPSGMGTKVVLKNILIHISVALLTAFGTIVIYLLLIRIGYGKFPSFHSFMATQVLFSKMGFTALPMPLIHPWNIVILIYLLGLLNSIYSIIHKQVTCKSAMVFLFTLMGFGTFMYYQGRSHNWNLYHVWWPFFIISSIFADDLLGIIKRHGVKIYHCIILVAMLVYMLSFSFIDILANRTLIYYLFTIRNRWYGDFRDDQTMKNINFIRKYAQKGEEILILSRKQAVYFSESGTLSAFNPGLYDLFYKADYERLLEVIKNKDSLKIFVEPSDTQIPLEQPDIANLLRLYYREQDSNGSVKLFRKL